MTRCRRLSSSPQRYLRLGLAKYGSGLFEAAASIGINSPASSAVALCQPGDLLKLCLKWPIFLGGKPSMKYASAGGRLPDCLVRVCPISCVNQPVLNAFCIVD